MPPQTAVRSDHAAAIIERAWSGYVDDFQRLTCRARERFGARDWAGLQSDAAARLELYTQAVHSAIAELEGLLGDALRCASPRGWR